ncbi:transposase [Citricoccus nitrophenolicus]
MTRTETLLDEQWEVIEPLMPTATGAGQPFRDHRMVVEGIIYRYPTGFPSRCRGFIIGRQVAHVRSPTVGGMQIEEITVESSPLLSMGEVAALYREVGWTMYADDVVTLEAALAGSSCVVAARRDGRLIGLARVISDPTWLTLR